MPQSEQPDVPIWAANRAKKHDIVREVAVSLEVSERERASRPIEKLTERDLESEQGRLQEMLHFGTATVADFRRLREVDFYLHGMRERRSIDPAREEWSHEWQSD